MRRFFLYLLLTAAVSAAAGWGAAFYQHKQRAELTQAAEVKRAKEEQKTRESLIDSLATPEMRAYTERQDASYQAWAEGQISGICHLHHTKMKRKWLPVEYGMPDLSLLATKEEGDTLFPFPDEGVVNGPCTGGNIQWEEVHICNECTEAHNKWLNESHPKRPNPEKPEK